MTERIIDFLDALVATVGSVEKRYCLVEKRADVNGTNIPYKYTGNGNYQAVNVDGGSISYWRIVNSVSFDVVDGNKAVKNLQASYPIRYVAMVRRDDINPLTFSQDVANVLEGRNKDLQTQLQAKNVNITVGSIDTDTVKIWSEEFAMPLSEPNYTRSMVMIDLTVTVIAARSCWESCDNFPDILQGFDWCDPSTYQRLTQQQQDCLQDFLCGVCADATVQLNGTTVGTVASGDTESFTVNLDGSPSGVWDGTAWQVTSPPCDDATIELNGVEMTTIPSGDTENITVLQSSGATQVGSKQGTHFRIDDSAISINGSPVADVKAEDPLDIDVTQNGSPVGSWNGSAWIVPPCADGTVENSDQTVTVTVGSGDTEEFPDTPISANSDLVINQPSGVAKDLVVRYETQGVAPTTIVGGEVVVPDTTLATSVTLSLSDATPNWYDTINLTATASNFTPTNYEFHAFNARETKLLQSGASNTVDWEIDMPDVVTVYVIATDGTYTEISKTEFTITGFITIWKPYLASSGSLDTIAIPTISSGTYNCDIYWSDGTSDLGITTYNDAAWTHVFPSTSEEVWCRVEGQFEGISMVTPYRSALFKIMQWDGLVITAWRALRYCDNLTEIYAIDAPVLSATNCLLGMLQSNRKLQFVDFSNWDLTTQLNGQQMIEGCGALVPEKCIGLFSSGLPAITILYSSLRSVGQGDWRLRDLAWNTTINMGNFLLQSGTTPDDYTQTLLNMLAAVPVPTGGNFHFGYSKLPAGGVGETAKNTLVTTYGNTIVDGGTF